MSVEKYGRKEYVEQKCIEEVRIFYRTRFGQRPFAGNFSHDRKFTNTGWLCRCGQEKEKEMHIISGSCPVYSDIREKFGNLQNDSDLVDFFNQVLARRDRIDDLERDERDSV